VDDKKKSKDQLKVGDLVVLFNNASKKSYSSDVTEEKTINIGIVLEKLTELFVFPSELEKTDISSTLDVKKVVKKTKNSVKTKICKVYWFDLKKNKWEYEDDLQVIEDETSDS